MINLSGLKQVRERPTSGGMAVGVGIRAIQSFPVPWLVFCYLGVGVESQGPAGEVVDAQASVIDLIRVRESRLDRIIMNHNE